MIGIVRSPVYREHLPGLFHPEAPERLDAIDRALASTPFGQRLTEIAPRPATDDELAACHDSRYIELARAEIQAGATALSTGDTDVCAETWDAALLAAGGVCAAVDAVLAGDVSSAFAAVRPPGHHATYDRGMGFCVFNNIAIGACYAQERHGIGRVLIVDWDVHHGNGTQDIFFEDPSVLYFSTHQWPHYPGTGGADETGDGDGDATTVNCPLPAGSGGDAIVNAWRDYLLPAADAFRPEFVFISAGFDSCDGDPLGDFHLVDDDYIELTRLVCDIADRHANGRLVSVLEGGYALDGLARGVTAHVSALAAREDG